MSLISKSRLPSEASSAGLTQNETLSQTGPQKALSEGLSAEILNDIIDLQKLPSNALVERLFDAARANDPQRCLTVIKAGAPVNARGVNDLTALHVCGVMDSAEAAEALISAGADIEALDERGRSALHASALACGFNVSKALLKAGADPHARDEQNKTPIAASSWNGDALSVMLLLSYGADPNAQDKQKRAPLHQAMISNNQNLQAIWALVESGADASLVDNTGRSPLDYAQGERHNELAEVLSNTSGSVLMSVKLEARRIRGDRKIMGLAIKRRRQLNA